MQDATLAHDEISEPILSQDRGVRREEERILATIPSQTYLERYGMETLESETYRQALKAMLATPAIEKHLNYITASLIVTIFGAWLAGKFVLSRTFSFFIDLVLFITSFALAGLLIGILLGEVILPVETIPVLLFAALVVLTLLMGFALRGTIVTIKSMSQKRETETLASRGVAVYRPEQRQWHEITNHRRKR